MTLWYWSIRSNDQSLGSGSGSVALASGNGPRCGLARLTTAPWSASCRGRRALFLEEIAEHRVDLRRFGGLAHREVRVVLGELRVLFPQVLFFLGHLHVGKVAYQRQQLVGQQLAAAARVVVPVVTVARLRAVDVPVAGRVTRA